MAPGNGRLCDDLRSRLSLMMMIRTDPDAKCCSWQSVAPSSIRSANRSNKLYQYFTPKGLVEVLYLNNSLYLQMSTKTALSPQ